MNCSDSYKQVSIGACDDITLPGLPVNTSFVFRIRRSHHRNVYSGVITTDADGKFKIEKILFPDGYFAPGNFYFLTFLTMVSNPANELEQWVVLDGVEFKGYIVETIHKIETVGP